MPPSALSTPSPTRLLPALLAAVACTLLLGLSVFPPSSTRIYAWPWAGFATVGWLLPLSLAFIGLVRKSRASRFGGLIDAGLALLAVAATASAFISPLRGAVQSHLLPVLGACALPFALLPVLQPDQATRTWRISGFLLGLILLTSLLLWLQPWNGLPSFASRNPQPFGHANITGSVAVLATTWLAAGAARESGRIRLWFSFGALLALATAVSSGSRGSVLALAAAGACAGAISLLRRGRFLWFAALILLIFGGAIASNSSLRSLVVHGQWNSGVRGSNDQRTAMIHGGLRLGAERPLLGWGAGSVPHVFPRVRADLPGDADNFLQLHNTPVQLWATLGAAGLLAAALIIAGLATRLRSAPWTPELIALASGLAASGTLLLFDHPFTTPLFATLAAAHLAAWSVSAPHTKSNPIGYSSRLLLAVGGLALFIPAAIASTRDLAARRAYSDALDHAAVNDQAGYAASLRRASEFTPGDPYYAHLLAAQLAIGHPFPDARGTSPRTAAALLERTLQSNPDLEYARYNLGWLLLGTAPETAASHFLASARLAPQRRGVYLGLGLARIQSDDTDGAVRAFAAEWLLDPASAWSPAWRQPPLDAFLARIQAVATQFARTRGADPWTSLDTPATVGNPHRRLRTGYGVLMGHPEGVPPADFNIQTRITLPPELRPVVPRFGWLDGGTLLQFLDNRSP